MKIRSGFVSNSSSSSYIIEFEDFQKIVTIAGEEISVKDFLDAITMNTYECETEMHECVPGDLSDLNDMIQYVDSILKWSDDKDKIDLIELKKDIKSSRKNGKYFARFDLSYHNKSLNFLLKLLSKYELFKIRLSTEK